MSAIRFDKIMPVVFLLWLYLATVTGQEVTPELLRQQITEESTQAIEVLLHPSEAFLPVLPQALSAKNPELRWAAACGLGKLKAKVVVAEVARLCDDPVPKVREACLWALGELQGERYLSDIQRLCADRHPEVRAMAFTVLAKVGHEKALPVLLAGLGDLHEGVSTTLERLLSEKTWNATMVPALLTALKNPNGRARINAIHILGNLKEEQHLPHLVAALKDKSLRVVAAAADTLAGFGTKVSPFLIEALQQEKEDVPYQLAILSAMEKLRDPDVLPVLLTRLESTHPQVRRKAIALLGEWHVRLAGAVVAPKVSDPDKLVRATAVWALGEFTELATLPEILKAAKDPAWEVRCAALGALAQYGSKIEIFPKLSQALRDDEWQVRHTAVIEAGKLRCHDMLPQLHEILEQGKDREEVLSAIGETLGKIGDAQSLPYLLEALLSRHTLVRGKSEAALQTMASKCLPQLIDSLADKDSPLDVRTTLAAILARVQGKDALPLFYTIARDRQERGKLRYNALLFLGEVAKEEAVPLLLEKLEEEDSWVQRGAVLALGKLQERRALARFFSMLPSAVPLLEENLLSAICNFPPAEVMPWLDKLFTTEPLQDPACIRAIRIAGVLRIHQAIPFLERLRQKQEWQAPAQWALQEINKKETTEEK